MWGLLRFPLSGICHLQEASSWAGADKTSSFLCWARDQGEEKVGFLLGPHEVTGNGLSPI